MARRSARCCAGHSAKILILRSYHLSKSAHTFRQSTRTLGLLVLVTESPYAGGPASSWLYGTRNPEALRWPPPPYCFAISLTSRPSSVDRKE